MKNNKFTELSKKHKNLAITFTQDDCFGCNIMKEEFKDVEIKDLHHMFVIFDPKGEVEKMMGIGALPTTVYVTQQNPINSLMGPISPDTLRAQIIMADKVMDKITKLNKNNG